jgi:TonB family protein
VGAGARREKLYFVSFASKLLGLNYLFDLCYFNKIQTSTMRSLLVLLMSLGLANTNRAQSIKSFTDNRDGKVYPTVVIGTQEWMAANIAYKSEKGYFLPEGGEEVGGLLYTYDTACNVCPEGWSLPSDSDWMNLVRALNDAGLGDPSHGKHQGFKGVLEESSVDDFAGIAYACKSVGGWRQGTQGSNKSNFNAIPTGWIEANQLYAGWGEAVQWWTKSTADQGMAWSRGFHGQNPYLQRFKTDSKAGLAVRCWRNAQVAEIIISESTTLVEDDTPFMIVEEMPALGDCKKLRGNERHQCTQMEIIKFISQNTQFPSAAIDANVQGTVFIYFVVDKKGLVRDAKVMREVHPILDAEALRVIRSLPAFEPGMQRGEPVSVQYTIPVKFIIRKKNSK